MSDLTPKTIKDDNRSRNRDFNLYTEEYFGGSDVFIYMNGKRNYDIAHVQYSIQEQHKPIYGYGSRTFDDLAVGNRIVVGAIKIPVKNPNNSSFDKNWGKPKQQAKVSTQKAIAPSWVYNYRPEKKDNSVVNKNEEPKTFSLVAKVQSSLGIEPNGFIDEKTRSAISSYRKDNGMMMGTLIDNELTSKLNIDDYNCYAARDAVVYDSPIMSKPIFTVPVDSKLVYIAADKDTVLIRDEKGKSGFIDIKDVYRG